MHPILAFRGRLGPYLAAWVPLAGLLSGLLRIGGVTWLQAAVIAVPLAVVYAFMSLAAWYPCRSAPLQSASFARVVVTQLAAAALSAMLWLFLADTWVVFLEQFPAFSGAAQRFPHLVVPLLAAGGVLYALAAALHYVLIGFEEARRAERSALELEVLAREAELRALRAQIDPHFLFNALNAISSLITSDPGAARAMCLELGEFLRESARVGGAAAIPLAEEVRLAERYLTVERARFGERLRVEREVGDGAGACAVPPLLLQPLVENAVRHGIAQLVDGGVVRIAAHCAGGCLHVTVENPVCQAPPETRRGGLGLANVRDRIATLYGADGRLDARVSGGAFRVDLTLPASAAR
ncbi:MAG TPA: histidine kinase [Thermoanaerobaculaceae bacterium]|nr:histidine kinase [Thermoanaerobaculaceae bacterium]